MSSTEPTGNFVAEPAGGCGSAASPSSFCRSTWLRSGVRLAAPSRERSIKRSTRSIVTGRPYDATLRKMIRSRVSCAVARTAAASRVEAFSTGDFRPLGSLGSMNSLANRAAACRA